MQLWARKDWYLTSEEAEARRGVARELERAGRSYPYILLRNSQSRKQVVATSMPVQAIIPGGDHVQLALSNLLPSPGRSNNHAFLLSPLWLPVSRGPHVYQVGGLAPSLYKLTAAAGVPGLTPGDEHVQYGLRALLELLVCPLSEPLPFLPERLTEFTKDACEGGSFMADWVHRLALLRAVLEETYVIAPLLKPYFVINTLNPKARPARAWGDDPGVGPLLHWLRRGERAGFVEAGAPGRLESLLTDNQAASAGAVAGDTTRCATAIDPKTGTDEGDGPRRYRVLRHGLVLLGSVTASTAGEQPLGPWLTAQARSLQELWRVLDSVHALAHRAYQAALRFDPNGLNCYGPRNALVPRHRGTYNQLHGCTVLTALVLPNLNLVFDVGAFEAAYAKIRADRRGGALPAPGDYPLVLLATCRLYQSPVPLEAEGPKRARLLQNVLVCRYVQYLAKERPQLSEKLEALRALLRQDPQREGKGTQLLFRELWPKVEEWLRRDGAPRPRGGREYEAACARLYPRADLVVGETCVRWGCMHQGAAPGHHDLSPALVQVLLFLFASSCYAAKPPPSGLWRDLLLRKLAQWLEPEGNVLGLLLYLEGDEACSLLGWYQRGTASPSVLAMLESHCRQARGGAWAPDLSRSPVARLLALLLEHPLCQDLCQQLLAQPPRPAQWPLACLEFYERAAGDADDHARQLLLRLLAKWKHEPGGRPAARGAECLRRLAEQRRSGRPGLVSLAGGAVYVHAPDAARPPSPPEPAPAAPHPRPGTAYAWNRACLVQQQLVQPAPEPGPWLCPAAGSDDDDDAGDDDAPVSPAGGPSLHQEGEWISLLPYETGGSLASVRTEQLPSATAIL